jgi:hypothetical protein
MPVLVSVRGGDPATCVYNGPFGGPRRCLQLQCSCGSNDDLLQHTQSLWSHLENIQSCCRAALAWPELKKHPYLTVCEPNWLCGPTNPATKKLPNRHTRLQGCFNGTLVQKNEPNTSSSSFARCIACFGSHSAQQRAQGQKAFLLFSSEKSDIQPPHLCNPPVNHRTHTNIGPATFRSGDLTRT